jgi:hypothetical protein
MPRARPIHSAPKDGKVIFVGDDHGFIAKVFWHYSLGPMSADGEQVDGFWCYAINGHVEQIDFEPTRWAEDATDFERD